MRPRQNLIEIFSTFLQFEHDRFDSWIADPRLRRSMDKRLEQGSQHLGSKDFWVLYWHKRWQSQSQPLPQLHLTAYLQETCYYTARKLALRFSLQQYGVADCFQMAIAEVEKVLNGFDPERSSAFDAFARMTFSSIIINLLRRRREIDICTDWLLLRKLSRKQLLESLSHAGLSAEMIEQRRLAWMCFNQLYALSAEGSTQKLSAPDAATWAAIAHLYNQERTGQLRVPGPAIEAKTAEQWMLTCSKQARAYLYPNVASLNVPKPGYDSGELQDALVEAAPPTLVDQMVVQEELETRQHQCGQVSQVLQTAIAALDAEEQELLGLYYRQGLTQQQIAETLAAKQYTVSRRLTRARKTLLTALSQWSQTQFGVKLSTAHIEKMSGILEEWLQGQYAESEAGS